MGNNPSGQAFLPSTCLLLTFRLAFRFLANKIDGAVCFAASLLICVNFTMEIIVNIKSVSQIVGQSVSRVKLALS